MSEPATHRDPTWPYEDIEEVSDITSEPSWECPADHCTCHPSKAERGPDEAIAILLCDDEAHRMPGARCRVLANGILLNEDTPNADGAGWIKVHPRRMPEQILIEWAPPDTPLEARYPYRKLHYVDLTPKDREEAARRRLHNLGYSARVTLADNIEEFQRAYEQPATGRVEDIEATLVAYHDAGTIPPRGNATSPAMGGGTTRPAMGGGATSLAVRDVTPGAPPSPQQTPPPQQAPPAPPPPAAVTGTSATVAAPPPPARLTITEAVARFKALVADPEVIERGQFAWRAILADKVELKAASLIYDSSVLNQRYKLDGTTRLSASNPLKKMLWADNLTEYQTARNDALAAIRDMRADDAREQAVLDLRKMLSSATKQDALALCDAVMKPYGDGEEPKVYRAIFDDPNYLRFGVHSHMYDASKDKCFAFVNATAKRLRSREVDKKKGLHGPPPAPGTQTPLDATPYSGSVTLDIGRDGIKPNQTPSYGQVVTYAKTLATMVITLKKFFDPGGGWVVRAGVESGLLAEKGLQDPDHWLLFIGSENDDFAFWDPDASVTHSIERAFGKMLFRKGDGSVTSPAKFPTKAHADEGRLTTADKDVNLLCDRGIVGKQTDGNKRYQVTHLTAI